LEKFEKWLWEITRYYLQTLADFEPEDFTFTLHDNGDRYTLNKQRTDARHYRIQSEVAQKLLARAKSETTDKANLIFDLNASPIRYRELESLKGTKGLIKISNLAVSSEIEEHDTLILTGITKDKKTLTEQNIRDLFNVTIQTEKFTKFETIDIEKQHQKNKKAKLDYLEKSDSAFMQREFTKFENWADDKIKTLESELKDERHKLRELEREQHKENIIAEELIAIQEKISKIKRKYTRLRQEIFDREDEINAERDQMISEAKGKLTRTINEVELFTVSFEII
jgi:hypothetical protein